MSRQRSFMHRRVGPIQRRGCARWLDNFKQSGRLLCEATRCAQSPYRIWLDSRFRVGSHEQKHGDAGTRLAASSRGNVDA